MTCPQEKFKREGDKVVSNGTDFTIDAISRIKFPLIYIIVTFSWTLLFFNKLHWIQINVIEERFSPLVGPQPYR